MPSLEVSIPDGFVNVTWQWLCSGIPDLMETSLGFQVEVGGDVTQRTLADDFTIVLPATWGMENVVSRYLYVGASCLFGPRPGDGPVVEGLSGVEGEADADPPPANCAVLVKKITPFGGRRNRGRMYWPPVLIDEVDVNARGAMTPAVAAFVQGKMNDLIAACLDIDGVVAPYLFHSFDPEGEDPPLVPTLVNSIEVEPVLATQRRRLHR